VLSSKAGITRASPGRFYPFRKPSGSVTYDDTGNLLSWNGNVYEYDPLHMMRRLTTPGGEDWLYVVTIRRTRRRWPILEALVRIRTTIDGSGQ